MSDHGPLCEGLGWQFPNDDIPCICDELGQARADERERIAQAIDAAIQGIWNGMDFGLLKAAQIARGVR